MDLIFDLIKAFLIVHNLTLTMSNLWPDNALHGKTLQYSWITKSRYH